MNKNEELIQKSGTVEGQELTDDELAKINKFTLKDLKKEDIYIFKLRICDNEIDRDFEVFPLSTLEKLKELFIGKTIIMDHAYKADNQVARIYDAKLITETGRTKTGEPYTSLIAYCYMVRTESNKDLIVEIDAGIKKEVSVGCKIGQVVCSICGVDNHVAYCEHYNGKDYDGKLCYFELKNPLDAYEVSFVAVPAQPKAGTTKSYKLIAEEKDVINEQTFNITNNSSKDDINENNKNYDNEDLINIKIKAIKSFIFAEKERGR